MPPTDQITAVLVVGVIILTGSLAPIYRVLKATENGRLRRAWVGLGFMIGGFVVGYGVVAATLPRSADPVLLTGVCVVLVSGSVFVWVVARLAEWTATEVARLTLREAEAITDPLTGLHNRRYFDERLREECLRAARSGQAMSVAMIDVDRFKAVNDTFGHPAGDQLLVLVSDALRCATRNGDVLARYGGEEFALFAPGLAGRELLTYCERLRAAVSAVRVTIGAGDPLAVTVSIGATDRQDEDAGALLAWADALLFKAKDAGRDRVIVDTAASGASAAPADPEARARVC